MIHVGQLFPVFFLPVRTSVTCAVMFCACPTSTWLVAWSSKWWSQTAWPLECWVTQTGYLSGNSECRQTTFNPCRYYETCCESLHVNQSMRTLLTRKRNYNKKQTRKKLRTTLRVVGDCVYARNELHTLISVCTLFVSNNTEHNTDNNNNNNNMHASSAKKQHKPEDKNEVVITNCHWLYRQQRRKGSY